MKASELRLGNYIGIIHENIETQVTVDHIKLILEGDTIYKPIPLTEEWLLKMGFIDRSINENNFTLSIRDSFVELFAGDYVDGDGHIIDIKYVHQLQNLYFALTGEELKITASQSKQQ